MKQSVRIAIADDQSIIREGLATMINLEGNCNVVIRAQNGVELIENLTNNSVELILLDIQMPVMGGLDTLKQLRKMAYSVPVIMLTTFADDQYMIDAMKLGAAGYVLKDIEIEELFMAMERVVHGHMVFPQIVQKKLIEQLSQQQKPEVTMKEQLLEQGISINSREEELLKLIALGYSNQRIADEVYLSLGTVKNYCSKLYGKLRVENRAELVSYLHQLLKI
ncbi:response regulator transcription factor [Gracilibacillus alcaliphilus]|uniref:response regulator transcription factor n=1 Tax=Gracilibacillus alcaliphilus TaxID=1401441 RepID=UPI001956F88E|nr:response regulator transcription factor [Gracilibacillus alcaliphilus]MBM7675353.1 DNA-binding NarL/FixJ family response regulator [Gracilibacillus alcaliphilus]